MPLREHRRNAHWLDDATLVEQLLTAQPEANVYAEQATHFLQPTLENLSLLDAHLHDIAVARGEELLAAPSSYTRGCVDAWRKTTS